MNNYCCVLCSFGFVLAINKIINRLHMIVNIAIDDAGNDHVDVYDEVDYCVTIDCIRFTHDSAHEQDSKQTHTIMYIVHLCTCSYLLGTLSA